MRVKFAAYLILTLCLLSLAVGLLNVNKIQTVQKDVEPTKKRAILEKISGGGDKIAIVTLQGPISYDMSGSFFEDYNSAENTLKSFNKALEDKSVKGVLFRINSPGGTVAMSQEIYDSILKLREKKPVVVSMADIAASGGYYIASAADRIYANPGTLTGSIGVIMETINAQGLLTDKLGIKSEVIKSGKFKDTGNMYRPLSEEERTLLSDLVNNAYKQFVDAIIQGRINRNDKYKLAKVNLTKENLLKYADGRIFTGEQALKYGFVDKLGGLEQAVEDIKKMAKEKDFTVSADIPAVNYNKPAGFGEFFFNISSKLTPQSNSFEYLMPFSKKYARQPLFIWE
ncbi:MAG TPA: signal peptide peptidase SppA [Candidatus Gastranaerophilales bacterium]|nr:signal peptide peptidase SppA [Candidatus Gastranaerophilales bacterium]